MKKVLLTTHRKHFNVFGYLPIVFLSLFISASFVKTLPAGENNVSKPTKEEILQKTQKLQMPFIANDGQVDERVKYYAKTFGGTVFVTKEGEIVYSLPSGRDVPAGASQEPGRGHEAWRQGSRGAEEQGGKVVSEWHGQAPLVRAESEFVVANAYSPLLHADNANYPPDRVFAKSLIAAYLPGLPVETTRRVVYPSSMPPNNNPHSEIQNPKSPIRGIALKETIIGAKVNAIQGEDPSVTKVNYFKGNDPEKWKTNVSTYNFVNLGEIYKGIELKLKAYGNNVEKLFYVKPGASPEQIKISLSGIQSLKNPPSLSPSVRGTGGCPPLAGAGGGLGARELWVNEQGQLEAETELGTVKFTKPVAYQEIDGKRVEVAVEYSIQESAVGDRGQPDH